MRNFIVFAMLFVLYASAQQNSGYDDYHNHHNYYDHYPKTRPISRRQSTWNKLANIATSFLGGPTADNRQVLAGLAGSALLPIVTGAAVVGGVTATGVAISENAQRVEKEREVRTKNAEIAQKDSDLSKRNSDVTTKDSEIKKLKEDMESAKNKASMCNEEEAAVDVCKPGFVAVCKKSDAAEFQYADKATGLCASGFELNLCGDMTTPDKIKEGKASGSECAADHVAICPNDLLKTDAKQCADMAGGTTAEKSFACVGANAKTDVLKKCTTATSKASACKNGGNPAAECMGEEVAKCVKKTGDEAAPAGGDCSTNTNMKTLATVCTIATQFPNDQGKCV